MNPRAASAARLVALYPREARALINASRRALRAAFPRVIETPDTRARLLSYHYGPGYKGVVATLILSRAGAKIGLPYGVSLPDPSGLLEGAGKVHRHVRVTSEEVLRSEALRVLLAAQLAAWRRRVDDAGDRWSR